MGVVASAKGDNSKDFELATEMIQQAVLADVVDKGMVPNKFKPGTEQHKAYFVWVLEEVDSEGRNKRVFESFTVSLHEKASLRKRLKELGIKIDESTNVDLDTLIGTKRTLVLSTEDGKDGGKPFVRVLATQKAVGKGMEIPKDFVRKQDQTPKA
jgi:hypothetical protein